MTTVMRQIHFEVKDRRKRIVDGAAPVVAEAAPEGRVPRVAKLMALAIRFEKLLRDGTVTNQSELAHLAQVTQPRMTQIMNLLHLAPDIQEEILFLPPVTEGRDPVTERDVRPTATKLTWSDQRAIWRNLTVRDITRLRSGCS